VGVDFGVMTGKQGSVHGLEDPVGNSLRLDAPGDRPQLRSAQGGRTPASIGSRATYSMRSATRANSSMSALGGVVDFSLTYSGRIIKKASAFRRFWQ
jgi:hypothetical protein